MKKYNVKPGETVFLGHRWEHHARRIIFDISEWVDDFGAGTVQLLHQRQGDEAPYPVAITRTAVDGVTVDDETGTLVHWDVTSADTHYLCHYGKAELRYYRGAQVSPEFLAKSDISNTVVDNALGAALADAPEEEPDWLATLLDATGSVDSQIEAARGYAEDAERFAGDAETYAGNALSHAGDASDAQSAAETFASNAAASAQEAETHKNEIANMYVSARSLPTGQEASVQIQESITLPRQLAMRFGIPRGEKGDTGATFTPSVSASGDLSWSNDGGLTNPETRNIRGPSGVSVTDVTQTVTSLESGGGNTVTVTLSDGSARSFNVMNGAKGDKGDPFQIAKTYASVAAMNADTTVSSGSFVMIASNTEDPDNAKLYVKGDNGFTFITDLSGAQGIQGPAGVDGVSILSVTHTTDANGNILLTVTLSNGNAATFTVPKGDAGSQGPKGDTGPQGPKGDTGTFSEEDLQRITALESENNQLRELLRGVDAPIYRTASGNPATFDDGAAANVKELSVEITPTQSGSGDPSPTNIRPITGVTSVSVTRSGKNLFDPSGLLAANSWSVDANGDYSGDASYLHSLYHVSKGGYRPTPPFKKSVPYSLSFDFRTEPNAGNIQGLDVRQVYTDNLVTPGGIATAPIGEDFQSRTFTTPAGKTLKLISLSYSAGGAVSHIRNIQLEEGAEATAYEPYQGQSVTVPLVDSNGDPLTVYGGTLDVTTGTLSVTWANIASYNGETLPGRWISDRDVYASGATPTTGAQVVYELLSPFTYHLTPQQLATLSGYNSVSTDAQNLTLEYQSNLNDVKVLTLTDIAASSLVGEQHRMTFGGRNLGSAVTPAQLAAIRDGSFSGLLVGDYWTINGVTWRIVDMDYWYGCGDAAFNRHHLVIMPDSNLTTAKMNETNTTTGGYTGSKMYTDTLPTVKTTCAAAFPDLILSHQDYLVSATSNGKPSNAIWADSDVELPSEIMMYGSHITSPGNDGATVASLYTINRSQLALFNLVPRFIKASAWFWLRDPVSATDFATVRGNGRASNNGASDGYGVRPVFAVG